MNLAKTILSLTLLLSFTSCSLLKKPKNEITVVHWNIKELDSTKIHRDNEQIKAVSSILKELDYDLLSINEMQYDLASVPNRIYQTTGKNPERLLELMEEDPLNYAVSFHQANTGNKARKLKSGNYPKKMTRSNRRLADPNNFGLFPGQYSSALISKFPIKNEVIISDLKWMDFNKKLNLSKYRSSNKKKLPRNIELFDKTFSDVVIEVNGKEVHIITLHTVPTYHFGNKNSPNYVRNKDQLRFLEWYLTGGTDIAVKLPKKYSHLKPLKKSDRFIAMGDWNTSIYANNPGSEVLRRMFKQMKLWINKPNHTYESQHFGKKRKKMLLDYIAFRGIDLIESGIYHPKESTGTCTKYADISSRLKSRHDRISASKCFNEKSVELKTASDHFPIWARFKLKD